VLHQGSMNGVRVRFLNRDKIVSHLATLARKLLASNRDVLEVSLFGSLVRGDYAPGSDADVYILLKNDSRRWMDRIPEFLRHFSGVGVPVEVFPYTVEEVAMMGDREFVKTVKKEKIVLCIRSDDTPGVQSHSS
jgi:predicted nucleotidyltransferase